MKRLHLVVSNSRFLIFPWVKVPNLASKTLSLVTARLADDWQDRYGYRPVLVETFVDREKYFGTCYQAANWQKIGETAGRGRFDRGHDRSESIKDIYVQPLVPNFRDILLRGESATKIAKTVSCSVDSLSRIHDPVLAFWATVAPLIRSIAADFDCIWQIKRRVIDSMLLVLLIFRLVATSLLREVHVDWAIVVRGDVQLSPRGIVKLAPNWPRIFRGNSCLPRVQNVDDF